MHSQHLSSCWSVLTLMTILGAILEYLFTGKMLDFLALRSSSEWISIKTSSIKTDCHRSPQSCSARIHEWILKLRGIKWTAIAVHSVLLIQWLNSLFVPLSYCGTAMANLRSVLLKINRCSRILLNFFSQRRSKLWFITFGSLLCGFKITQTVEQWLLKYYMKQIISITKLYRSLSHWKE